jgi:beta-galactosidase
MDTKGNSQRFGNLLLRSGLVATLALASCAYTQPTVDRSKTLLNGTWKFIGSNSLTGAQGTAGTGVYDDSSWATVTIPHTWDRPNTVAQSWSNNDVTQYTNAWYRTPFTLASGDSAKKIYVVFEGASQIADVYVNGNYLGQHRGAYTRFTMDATSASLKYDGSNNYLAVKVNAGTCQDCLPGGVPTFWKGWGGLYRKVSLLKTNAVQVDTLDFSSPGVYITPQSVTKTSGSCTSPTTLVGSATLNVVTKLRNDTSATYTIKHTLTDASNNIIGSAFSTTTAVNGTATNTQNSSTFTGLSLWHPGNPALYTLWTEVISGRVTKDVVANTIGFRSYTLTTTASTLNGCNVPLRGVSKHQESEQTASAMTDANLTADWDDLQDLGVNYVRLPHYPHSELEYNLADQRGMAVWAENGFVPGTTTPPADLTNQYNINKEMVYQNMNHPSILLWSAGNELNDQWGETGLTDSSVSPMAGVIRTADPSRPVMYAQCCSAGNVPGTFANVDFTAMNLYEGWYLQSMYDFGPEATAAHFISESGAGSTISLHTDDMFETTSFTPDSWEPEEYAQMVVEYKHQIIFVSSPGSIPVYSNWVFRDFSDYKWNGRWNTKGFVNYGGFKKDIYYHMKSFLKSTTYSPYLTSTTSVMHLNGCHNVKRGGGTGDTAAVKIYSNAGTVYLNVNGVSKGSRTNGSYQHPDGTVINNGFYFANVLSAGKNVLQACDSSECSGSAGANTDTCTIYYNPPTTEADALVSNLTSSNSGTTPNYLVIQPKDQWPVYQNTGANNTFDALPSNLASGIDGFILNRRQSYPAATTNLSFSVTATAKVYLMFSSADGVPSWVTNAGFTDTGVTGQWHDDTAALVPAKVYSKCVASGGSVSFSGTTSIDSVVMLKRDSSCGGASETPVNTASPPPGSVTLVVTGNPASGPYAVEAQTTLTGALTVNFFVDGSFVHQENVAKYCLFGGDGPCATGTLGAGAHVIKAQVLAQGTATVLAETQITVTE